MPPSSSDAHDPLRRARAWGAARWRQLRAGMADPYAPARGPETERRRRRGLQTAAGVLASLALVFVLFLLLFDWNMLRGPISRFASAQTGRQIAITGDLEVRPWSLKPAAAFNGVVVDDPEWAGEGKTAQVERLTVQMELLPLLRGHRILTRLEVRHPDVRLLRAADGRHTWDFSKDDKPSGEPLELPLIRRFVIEEGELRFEDRQRDLTFSGTISAQEEAGGAQGFRLAGDGRLNGEPFRLRVGGGPLINIDPGDPYPFDAEVRAGATRITAKGALPEPFDLGRFHLDLTAVGPDLADLYRLTGLALPNTPPYELKGRLVREGRVYSLDDLGGRLGDSDIRGDLRVDTREERPFLHADLRSRRLDFDDLATVFGGAPATGEGETASQGQQAVARQMQVNARIFPDSPLQVERIRAMDAELSYRAEAIEAPHLPLRGADLHLTLDKGLLNADRVVFSLPQGDFSGAIQLDARQDVPVTTMDMRLSGARLEQLIPVQSGGAQPLRGDLVGRVQLRGRGLSVHDTMSTADGEVVVVIPQGEVREAFAELLGVNVVKGLGLLLSGDQSQVPIRCAVGHFRARNGVLRSNQIVFDTEPVLGHGEGRIDLGRERMSVRIDGEAKEPRLIRLMAPVTVSGPLRKPSLGVEAGGAIAQAGLAAALGAVAAPLAALLPFVDPGLAEDAACGALIAEARRQGAPAD